MKIAVIYGGKSGEHEVSKVSAAAILKNLEKNHTVVLIGIAKNGIWYLQEDFSQKSEEFGLKIQELESKIVSVIPGGKKNAFCVGGKSLEIDAVFPALHGTFGEDGTVQGLLELADVPFVGSDHMASAISFDKEKTKAIWQSKNLPVVPGFCINRAQVSDSRVYDEFLKKCEMELGFPLFVKPCSAGSSNGAEKAPTMRHLHFALGQAFLWDDKVLVEKAIDAREIECAVTGSSVLDSNENVAQKIVAHALGEIAPKNGFYDYESKYEDENAADLIVPAKLDPALEEKIKVLAKKAYRALDAEGMSRVDFFLEKSSGKIFLNEINSIPGFTKISMFPKLCAQNGLDFENLLENLLEQAILRHNAKSKLLTSRQK